MKSFLFFASPLYRVKEALHPMGKLYHTQLPVLRDVTFKIPGGHAVAILGPDGVGKSTLLHLAAAGVLKPSSGMVAVSGSVFALLDLSVFEARGGSISSLDTRLGVLHLTVTSTRRCKGVVDLEAVFVGATLGRGDVGMGFLVTTASGPAVLPEPESRGLVNSTESASGGTEVIL